MDQTKIFESFGVAELLDRLAKTMLLSAEEMDQAVSLSKSAADGHGLARELVLAGLLTSFQVQAVCSCNFGELRIGNYDVIDRIGAGGMGTVFKGRHRRMKRIVALKVLSRSLAADQTFVRRFQREVETLARLNHPNIVMAFDADEDEAGPFLVMEYVEGLDLATLVDKQGPLDVPTALDCLLQTARGLDYAHQQGIIHRDIKPANLLRDASGTVKITDLGLARLSGLADAMGSPGSGSITRAGGVMGTVDFMSPEQAVDSTTIDHRADIYSLGATFYFLLVGQPPYQGNTMMATLLHHRQSPIPSLAAACPGIPVAIDSLFRRMMAKTPQERPQSMGEIARALEGNKAGPAVLDPATKFAPAPTAAPSETTAEGAGPAPTRKPPVPAAGTSPKILLVEPSRTQSSIIRKYLQTGSIEQVVAVASGQEALAAVRGETPHVIISAQHLPDMTGVELAQQIRGMSKEAAPGFVLIFSEAESIEMGSLSKGGQGVLLHKPFTPEQLVAALRTVSGERASPAPPCQKERSKLRVLIVDDSAAARLHVRGVLQGLGLERFEEAADGAQAVAAAAREDYDLIVTDYNMPYMDGRGLIGYLKQNPATASVPIIMVTTEQDPVKLAEVRQLGVAAICEKHFPPEIIGKIIDQLEKTS